MKNLLLTAAAIMVAGTAYATDPRIEFLENRIEGHKQTRSEILEEIFELQEQVNTLNSGIEGMIYLISELEGNPSIEDLENEILDYIEEWIGSRPYFVYMAFNHNGYIAFNWSTINDQGQHEIYSGNIHDSAASNQILIELMQNLIEATQLEEGQNNISIGSY